MLMMKRRWLSIYRECATLRPADLESDNHGGDNDGDDDDGNEDDDSDDDEEEVDEMKII